MMKDALPEDSAADDRRALFSESGEQRQRQRFGLLGRQLIDRYLENGHALAELSVSPLRRSSTAALDDSSSLR